MQQKMNTWIVFTVMCYTVNAIYIVSRETLDNDHNGHLDGIRIVFSEDVDDEEVDTAVRNFAFDVEGYYINITAGWVTLEIIGDGIGELVLYEKSEYLDTGGTPGVLYSSTLITGLAPDADYVTANDTAPPVIVAACFPTDGFCAYDQVPICLSEGITFAAITSAFYTVRSAGQCTGANPPFVALEGDPANRILTAITQVLIDSEVPMSIGGDPDMVTDLATIPNPIFNTTFNLSMFSATQLNPVILSSVKFLDTDQNGHIDAVMLSSVNAWNDTSFYPPVSADNNITTSPAFIPQIVPMSTCPGDPRVVAFDYHYCFLYVEKEKYDTSLTGTYDINVDPFVEGWRDYRPVFFSSVGRMLPTSGTILDGAPAVMIDTTAFDTDANGYIDLVIVRFTEAILKRTTIANQWTINGQTDGILQLLTMHNQTYFPINNSTLIMTISPAAQPLNAKIPTITYNPYYRTLSDYASNIMERRTVLNPETNIIQGVVGRVGQTTLQLSFRLNNSVALNEIVWFGAGNSIASIVSYVSPRNMLITLTNPLTLDQLNTAYLFYNNHTTIVRSFSLKLSSNVATVIDTFGVRPRPLNPYLTIGGTASRVNLLAIRKGHLDTQQFDAMISYCQNRTMNQFYPNPCVSNPCGAESCAMTSPITFSCLS